MILVLSIIISASILTGDMSVSLLKEMYDKFSHHTWLTTILHLFSGLVIFLCLPVLGLMFSPYNGYISLIIEIIVIIKYYYNIDLSKIKSSITYKGKRLF